MALAGLVDVRAARALIEREIERSYPDIERLRGKLADDSVAAQAPAAVVDREGANLRGGETALAILRSRRRARAALQTRGSPRQE